MESIKSGDVIEYKSEYYRVRHNIRLYDFIAVTRIYPLPEKEYTFDLLFVYKHCKIIPEKKANTNLWKMMNLKN